MNNDDKFNINLSRQLFYESNKPVDEMSSSETRIDFLGIAYDIRRIREANFPPEYFSDGAWDILLELGSADRKGETVGISEVAARAGLPASTRQRYVQILINDGFVARAPDTKDRLRAQLCLTVKGRDALTQMVNEVLAKYLPSLNRR
jgi:DNA-binding MarR family transcriptional regulator